MRRLLVFTCEPYLRSGKCLKSNSLSISKVLYLSHQLHTVLLFVFFVHSSSLKCIKIFMKIRLYFRFILLIQEPPVFRHL